jgi:hypothetical protein
MTKKIIYIAAGVTALLLAKKFGPVLYREIKLVRM